MENAIGGRFACTSHPKNGQGRRREGFGAELNRDKPGRTFLARSGRRPMPLVEPGRDISYRNKLALMGE